MHSSYGIFRCFHETGVKKELIDYGYEVEKISMKEQTVIFNKIG